MSLVKCPRCELNYMNAGDSVCKVCYRETHGKEPKEEIEICSICNEAHSLPGKDVCLYCLKELSKHKGKKEENEESVEIGMDSVSGMDEIIPEMTDEIHNPEFHSIGDDLSLEEMGEQEETEEDDDGEEDD